MLGLCRRSSASEKFVTNNILNFEALMRKSIFAYTSRLSISNNAIIINNNNNNISLKSSIQTCSIDNICTIQTSWVTRETVWKSWTDK